MSHHGKLREHKACENCGHYVEKRFCPECGQENIETRQPFHYLFTISIEDFVHYDGRFWKTIRYLLFSPARLTKTYLSGKRNLYVPPVTLYIFISFITFFIPPLLPETNSEKEHALPEVQINTGENGKEKEKENFNNGKVDTKKVEERIEHDFPKAIFLYMPVFAFWLWLFHDKKKWYYFDHGIFTLHYFSFILLSCLLYILLHWIYSYFNFEKIHAIETIGVLFSTAFFFYFIYYFFHSHRITYQESKAVSRLKCTFLFFINSFFMLLFLILYIIIEMYITDKSIFTEIINAIKSD